jgi:hypothetical protein
MDVTVRIGARVVRGTSGLKESGASRAEIPCAVLQGLRPVREFLTQCPAQIRPNLIHILGLWPCEVVELVGVLFGSCSQAAVRIPSCKGGDAWGTLQEAHGSGFADVVGAHKRVAGLAERVAEPSLLVDVVAVRLQEMVLRQCGGQNK